MGRSRAPGGRRRAPCEGLGGFEGAWDGMWFGGVGFWGAGGATFFAFLKMNDFVKLWYLMLVGSVWETSSCQHGWFGL